MVNSFLNNYFGFNRQQRNGLLVLLSISFTLLVVRIAYPHFMRPGDIELHNLPLATDSVALSTTADTSAPSLFAFDPNTATAGDLQRLGLSEKTAATLIKFRRNFRFRQSRDLQKVYGISPQMLARLAPYVSIAEPAKPAKGENPNYKTVKVAVTQAVAPVELNTADSVALEAVKGIGPAFARRIIKYRSILGGYADKQQLREVYGITEEKYAELAPLFTVDPSRVTKLDLNKDDFRTINRHPYISYELTRTIFSWRKKTILDAVSLKEIVADDALYQRLLPYLRF